MFGGGIYVSQDIIYLLHFAFTRSAVSFCFASLISKDAQPLLEFAGNRANNSGQDMYGAYVSKCAFHPSITAKTRQQSRFRHLPMA